VGKGSLHRNVDYSSEKESRKQRITMEQQQETTSNNRGTGKEEQLTRIAAALNTASNSEANPESTKTMITSFINHFDKVALELVQELDNDQEDLLKKMIDEITKLQTKNMAEFERAIGKIVGITNSMIDSNNPKLQQLGQGMQDQAKSELFKAKEISLTGDKDTFMNRLGRQVGLNTEQDPVQGRQGIGKIAKGFASNIGSDIKRGFGIAVGADIEQEGTFYDRVVRSDEEKRSRELSRLEQSSEEIKTESITESFRNVIEELFKEANQLKQDSDKPTVDRKSVGSGSQEEEESAGISKNATVESLLKITESNLVIQENAEESKETLSKILSEVKKIAELMVSGSGSEESGGGGGILPVGKMNLGGMGKKVLGFAKKAAVPLTIAAGAYSAYSGFKSAGENEESQTAIIDEKVASGELSEEEAAKAKLEVKRQGRVEKGGAVGGGIGMAGGALAGAKAGALLGSFVGPAGTVVGGLAGGALGAFAGSGAGKYLGEKAGSAINWFKGDEKSQEVLQQGEVSGQAESRPNQGGFFSRNKGMMMGAALGPIGMAGGALYDRMSGTRSETSPNDAPKSSNRGMKVGTALGPVGMAAGALYDKMTGTRSETRPNDATKSSNRGMRVGAALGPIGMLGGALYDRMTGTTAKTETGRNVDSALIEAGTEATRDKMSVNVPPPVVINQGNQSEQQSGPTITAPGGVRNVRPDDPTWLRFQQRRAVA
jgi:hypothetical protein